MTAWIRLTTECQVNHVFYVSPHIRSVLSEGQNVSVPKGYRIRGIILCREMNMTRHSNCSITFLHASDKTIPLSLSLSRYIYICVCVCVFACECVCVCVCLFIYLFIYLFIDQEPFYTDSKDTRLPYVHHPDRSHQ